MSLSLFKNNLLRYMQNPNGIDKFEDFADKVVFEYDLLIKSGFQTINGNKIIDGIKPIIKTMFLRKRSLGVVGRSLGVQGHCLAVLGCSLASCAAVWAC